MKERQANPVAALSPYELEHLVVHLAAANRHPDIQQLLALQTADGRNAWCEAKQDAGLEASYMADLARGWEAAETSRFVAADAIADGIDVTPRYALASSSFKTQARNIPAALLARLVRYQVWPLKQAVQRARQVESAGGRAAALVALLPFVGE